MELEKSLCFKEKLCDDEVSTSVHLLLEVLEIFLVRGTVRVAMRVA
jgi:hypothetical protein